MAYSTPKPIFDTAKATEIKFSSLTATAANAPQNTIPKAKAINVAMVNKTERYANNKINNTKTIEKILALKVPVLIPTSSSSSKPASPVIDTLTVGTSSC